MPPLAVSDNKVLAPTWFFILFGATILGLGYTLEPFVVDIVSAFVLVALFWGTFQRIRGWVRRPWLASGLTCAWIVLVVAIPVSIVGYSLAVEALAAFDATRQVIASPADVARLLERARQSLGALGFTVTDEHVAQLAFDSASYVRDLVIDQATLALNNGLAVVVHFTITIVIVLYLFVDGPRLKRFAFDLSPLPNDEEELLVQRFVGVSRGILVGNGVGSLLQGVLGGIAMWVVGVPAPILWGAVMTLFAFLPILGISLIVIPAALYLILTGKVITGVAFFLFCMLQALVLENVVKTRLIGSQTRMHDLLVFLSIVGGLAGFGIFGLVYGPLIAVGFTTMADLYRRTYRHLAAERITRGSIADV
jgi:predicted PurR-regulated permease PerM